MYTLNNKSKNNKVIPDNIIPIPNENKPVIEGFEFEDGITGTIVIYKGMPIMIKEGQAVIQRTEH